MLIKEGGTHMENKMLSAVKPNDERDSAEVVAVARRRKFALSVKRLIVREADDCSTPGAVGEELARTAKI